MKKALRFMIYFLIGFVSIFIIAIISFSIINHNLQFEMPLISNIELYDNQGTKYLSVSNNKKQSYVSLSEISPYIIDAFISIEDKRFYDHRGVDFVRIIGATIKNIKEQDFAEGASTITQQYVRNVFLSHEKTIKRKIYEAMIAINFEGKYTKDEILEGYLNSIYFDHGIYGVEDASIYYFGKHANELTLVEACAIASIPKGPGYYSPIKNPVRNQERRNLILSELYKDEKITEDQYKQAINEELTLVGVNPNNENENAPYFQDLVLAELENMPWLNEYAYQGLRVYTTLDSRLNQIMLNSIKKRMPDSEIEVAIYAMEPKTGYVLSVIGGKDYLKSTYNRATDSVRQPGSSIKPFLYLTALENGFTPATTFMSEESTFYINNKPYSPQNYQKIYPNQQISMVYAIATSDNIYAVKTHLFLGPEKLVDTLKRFNFSGDIPALPSLALGTSEVSLQEITAGYCALANLGEYVEPTFITKVTTFDGTVLYEKTVPESEQVADPSTVYILNQAMTSIFDNSMTYNIRPTGGRIASLLHHKYAGKSGTTDTDNWMIGYNPDIVVGVWSGYDDNRPVTSAADLQFAKYIWADCVEGYLSGMKSTWYQQPSDVLSVELNPMSGFYPSFTEYCKPIYFKKNNIPWYIQLLYRRS